MNRAGKNFVQRSAVLSALLFLGFMGCGDEPPDPIGRLGRPSGLAYVARSDTRADLFIADSEAQGVRILRYESGEDGVSKNFVPGPVVYFPLILEAEGFPSQVVASRDLPQGSASTRLFTLSPSRAAIYVMDGTELPFEGRTLGREDNVTLGRIDLSSLMGEIVVPIDIEVLSSSRSGAEAAPSDYLAVLQEVLSGGSQLLILRVGRQVPPPADNGDVPEYQDVELIRSLALPPAPRDLFVRVSRDQASQGALLVSSSLTSSVTHFEFNTADPLVLTSSRTLDAGGATHRFVDLGAKGVAVTRLDRPSLVIFEPSDGGLERSTRISPSPLSEMGDEDPDLPGRIDLDVMGTGAAFPIAGAPGTATELLTLDGLTNLLAQPGLSNEIVLVLLYDGSAIFLGGDPLRPITTSEPKVTRVIQRSSETVEVPECGGLASSCTDQATAASCEASVFNTRRPDAGRIRVSYRGSLIPSHRGGVLRRLGPSDEGGVLYALQDVAVSDFGSAGANVQRGDLVLVQGRLACEEMGEVGYVLTGTIAGEPTSESVEVRFGGLLESLPPACTQDVAQFRYELYPAGEEVVVRTDPEGLGGQVLRFPTTTSTTTGAKEANISGPLSFTFRLRQNSACLLGGADQLACEEDADCGPGRTCGQVQGCGRRCSAGCAGDDVAGCEPNVAVRVCPGVDFEVTASPLYRVPLDDALGLRLAAPQDVVFSPLSDSWVASFPGSSAVLETRPLTRAEFEQQTARRIPFSRTLER